MSVKMFFLIRNERSYKRYYGQSIEDQSAVLYEIKALIRRYQKACSIPFDSRINKPLYKGERKTKFRMLCENLAWCFKYKEPCTYYYLYGLDLKARNPQDYISYTEFRVIRNILNIRQRENLRTKYTFNYLALTRDKFVFGQYAKSLGFPVPKTICVFNKGKVCVLGESGMLSFEEFDVIKKLEIDAFCKEISGEGGNGAFPLKISNGRYYIGSEEVTLEYLKYQISDKFYMVQERVQNHPIINSIYPYSVNTIRIMTVQKDGNIHLFDARMRTGANGSLVDNACFGGVVIGINPDGTLTDWGIREPGKSATLIVNEKHPDTGTSFARVKVPYYAEAVEMCKRFHSFYYGIPSMGWDVAITGEGPVLLEAGEDWEIANSQIFFGGRKKEFCDLHSAVYSVKLRKY